MRIRLPLAALATLLAGCVLGTGSGSSVTDRCAHEDRQYHVQQQSMEQTIEAGDYLLYDPAPAYGRGDIVVFDPPTAWVAGGVPFIKRVVATAGDTVEIRDDGFVYLNGAKLDEPYVYAVDGRAEPTIVQGQGRWTVAPGALFVLGDHRAMSADSRTFGTVPVSSVLGRATYRCSPAPGPIR